MAARIDAFTHVLPEAVYERLRDSFGFKGLSGDPSWLWELEPRFDAMDDFGVDKQVLTLALPPVWRGVSPADALPVVREANDAVAALADDYPDRFVAVGTIPYATDDYLAEFDRCVEDLGMAGVQVFSNVDGRPIDEAYADLFPRAAAADAPLWLHPQLYELYPWLADGMDHRLFGWPFDTTVALSRLVFSGVVVDHDIDVVAHHGGGMVPFFGERITQFYETRVAYPNNYPGLDFPDFEKPPIEYFADFHADTVLSGSTPALACTEAFFGADRTVFATDYPFGPDRGRGPLKATIDSIDESGLSADERDAVYGGNVAALL